MMNENYVNQTDEELIDLLRDGDKNVMEFLMDKYKNLVKAKANSMYILGAENDDLIQEGMIGLYKAARDYDAGRDASFQTFAQLCISRQMYTAIQSQSRKKHNPLNFYVSINGGRKDEEGNETDTELVNTLPIKEIHGGDPEGILIDKENEEELLNEIYEQLSPFEIQVYELCLTGMGYSEIAKVLGREEKSTDNAMQRVKNKIKKVLSKRN